MLTGIRLLNKVCNRFLTLYTMQLKPNFINFPEHDSSYKELVPTEDRSIVFYGLIYF
jgi:hypothetical protein